MEYKSYNFNLMLKIHYIFRYDEDRSGTLDKREVAKILNVKVPINDSYTLQTSGMMLTSL